MFGADACAEITKSGRHSSGVRNMAPINIEEELAAGNTSIPCAVIRSPEYAGVAGKEIGTTATYNPNKSRKGDETVR